MIFRKLVKPIVFYSLHNINRRTGMLEKDETKKEVMPTRFISTFLISLFSAIIFFVNLSQWTEAGSINSMEAWILSTIFFICVYGLWRFIGWRLNKNVDDIINEVNDTTDYAHEVIDDFLKWEEGDNVELERAQSSAHNIITFYEGVDQNGRVVLNWNDDLYPVPPKFITHSGYENTTLRDRESSQVNQRLRSEINGSRYSELISEVKSELNREMDELKKDEQQIRNKARVAA